MKSRRNVLSLVSFIVLPLLLMHFQNCAPSPAGANANASSPQVGLPESVGKTQIQFVTTQVDLQDDAPAANIDGFCNDSMDGATLHWSVWAGKNSAEPLFAGVTVCQSGRFSVNLDSLDQMVCGVSQMLIAEGTSGASNFTTFTRRCQPLASQPVAGPADSPAGTVCSLEYSPASVAEQRCAQVCYRDSKVVFQQTLDVTECSSLAAGLTGP